MLPVRPRAWRHRLRPCRTHRPSPNPSPSPRTASGHVAQRNSNRVASSCSALKLVSPSRLSGSKSLEYESNAVLVNALQICVFLCIGPGDFLALPRPGPSPGRPGACTRKVRRSRPAGSALAQAQLREGPLAGLPGDEIGRRVPAGGSASTTTSRASPTWPSGCWPRPGSRTFRIETGWGSVRWDESGLHDDDRLRWLLASCRARGIRPTLLLNAHHGVPCPNKTMEPGPGGRRSAEEAGA